MTSMAYQVAQNPEILKDFSAEELAQLEHDWLFWAREAQKEPEPFKTGKALIWLLLAGRGFGKTLTGAQTIRNRVNQGSAKRIGLVSQSAADARDVMVNGGTPDRPAGILSVCNASDPAGMPTYHPSKRNVTWPNGATATIFTAEDPDQIRGSNLDLAWCDELAAWPRLTLEATWTNLVMALRLGSSQCIITTTPRPIKLLKEIINRPTTFITRGSSFENLQNLSETFRTQVVEVYAGTRLGRQELNAEILEDTPGALWTFSVLEGNRLSTNDVSIADDMKRIVVAVDPSGSSKGHECGIMVGGLGWNGEGYLLADESLVASPQKWGEVVIKAFDDWMADCIVVETNFGAEMVKQTLYHIRPDVPVKEVRATQGKRVRAEPIATLDEQHKIHHVGIFGDLEAQMTEWLPEDGPNDRIDARVWLFTELKPARQAASVWFSGESQRQAVTATQQLTPTGVGGEGFPTYRGRINPRTGEYYG